MGSSENLLLSERFIITATASSLAYYFTNNYSTFLSTAAALTAGFIGWEAGGFLRNKKLGDERIYGFYADNGSYANQIGLKKNSMRWARYSIIKNYLSKRKNSFYLDNFRFSNDIKNNLNLINKHLAKKAEQKDLYMSWDDLKKGTIIVGSMGAGKTEFLNNIIVQYLDTNRKMIVHDTKGEFTKWFYNEDKDYIINFLDKRGVFWDFFKDTEYYKQKKRELEEDEKLKEEDEDIGIESELIYNFFSAFFEAKTGENKDKFWQSKAATRFTEIFNDIYIKDDIDTAEKLELLAVKLMQYLKTEHDSKTEQSVAATLEEAADIFFRFAFMKRNGNKEFLITKFFFEDTDSKIFLHTISNVSKQNIPFLTAFLDIIFRYQMSFFNNAKEEEYVLYVLDEYLTFFKFMNEDLRTQLHTKARSFGILLLPALQYFPDNKELKKDLLGSFKNLFIFSISDPETIDDVKRIVGKTKINDIKKVDNRIETEEKELFILDDNHIKVQNPGEHLTYIRDKGYLYKGYTRRVKVVDKNKEYIYFNKSKEFIKFKKDLVDKVLAENF